MVGCVIRVSQASIPVVWSSEMEQRLQGKVEIALPSSCAGNGALRSGQLSAMERRSRMAHTFVLVETKFQSYLI